ncbi:MAG: hypothetical protein ACJ77A_16280 [Actinomycetota bacterium]
MLVKPKSTGKEPGTAGEWRRDQLDPPKGWELLITPGSNKLLLRFDAVDPRFDAVDQRIDRLGGTTGSPMDAMQATVDATRSDLTQVALAVGVRPRPTNA